METLLEKTFKGVNLGENFAKSKNSLENFRKKLDELKSLEIDSELFIHEYFSSLRNEIDIDREECKVKVDKHFLEMIEEVDKIEADCKQKSSGVRLSSEVSRNEIAEVKEFEVDFERLRGELDKLEINFKSWENIETTSNQRVSRLEVLIENMENELLLDKPYEFAAYIERLEQDIVYGRIYTKLEKKSFKKNGSCQWTMNGIKKLSERNGFSVFSPDHLFNGSNWYVVITNADNKEMGLFLYRRNEEGNEGIDSKVNLHLFNQNNFLDNKGISHREGDLKFNDDDGFGTANYISFKKLFDGEFYDQENDSIILGFSIQYTDIQHMDI